MARASPGLLVPPASEDQPTRGAGESGRGLGSTSVVAQAVSAPIAATACATSARTPDVSGRARDAGTALRNHVKIGVSRCEQSHVVQR